MFDFLANNAPLVATLGILVTTIVAIGCGLEGFRIWAQRPSRTGDADAARIDRLERRVAVLERIATDRGVALGEEIEALRLAPRAHEEVLS